MGTIKYIDKNKFDDALNTQLIALEVNIATLDDISKNKYKLKSIGRLYCGYNKLISFNSADRTKDIKDEYDKFFLERRKN